MSSSHYEKRLLADAYDSLVLSAQRKKQMRSLYKIFSKNKNQKIVRCIYETLLTHKVSSKAKKINTKKLNAGYEEQLQFKVMRELFGHQIRSKLDKGLTQIVREKQTQTLTKNYFYFMLIKYNRRRLDKQITGEVTAVRDKKIEITFLTRWLLRYRHLTLSE